LGSAVCIPEPYANCENLCRRLTIEVTMPL
jgi:hypothetical protein